MLVTITALSYSFIWHWSDSSYHVSIGVICGEQIQHFLCFGPLNPHTILRTAIFIFQRRGWVTEPRLDHLVNSRAALGCRCASWQTAPEDHTVQWSEHRLWASCWAQANADVEVTVQLLCASVAFLKKGMFNSIKLGKDLDQWYISLYTNAQYHFPSENSKLKQWEDARIW